MASIIVVCRTTEQTWTLDPEQGADAPGATHHGGVVRGLPQQPVLTQGVEGLFRHPVHGPFGDLLRQRTHQEEQVLAHTLLLTHTHTHVHAHTHTHTHTGTRAHAHTPSVRCDLKMNHYSR